MAGSFIKYDAVLTKRRELASYADKYLPNQI